jgi:hypothetical protein
MIDYKERHPTLSHPTNQIHRLFYSYMTKTSRHFVEEQEARLGGESPGQVQPSLLAKSEISRWCLLFVSEAYQLKELPG